MKRPRPLLAVPLVLITFALAGCEGRPDRSAFAGGVAGATVGNQLSRGGAAATIGGAAIGAAIGADGARQSAARQATVQQPAQVEAPAQ